MTRSTAVQKRRAWETRFTRYRASGLSVTRFCQQEGVSVHTFYYWTKRLRRTSARATRGGRPQALPRCSATPTPTDDNARQAVVRLRWNTGAEALVPADCLDALRCLAECLTPSDGRPVEAFQEVVVKP